MFEGLLYRTLPHLNSERTITCVNMFDNGSERTFDTNQVRELIVLHNGNNNTNDIDL